MVQGKLMCRLALGVLSLVSFSAAQAQSSVTLYGVLDAGLLYTNKTLNTATGKNEGRQFSLVNSGDAISVFGLEGTEDLGGGLTAKFDLESGIDVANGGFDNSNGNLFGREAWVEVGGINIGAVKIGLQYSPLILASFDLDPRGFAQFGGGGLVTGDNEVDGFFDSNAISYTSPTIAGFTGSIMYALGGIPGNFSAGRQYSGSLKYQYGGLTVEAAILDEADSTDAAENAAAFTVPYEGRRAGLAYNFGSITVKASFANFKAPLSITNDIRSGGDNDVYNAGFDYKILPQLDLNFDAFYIRDPHDSGDNAILSSVGLEYYFSKTTSLYAEVGITRNNGNESFGMGIDGAFNGVKGTTTGVDVGFTHSF
jgi:predicted porin